LETSGHDISFFGAFAYRQIVGKAERAVAVIASALLGFGCGG
jgi:hypothetical protein